MTSVLAPDLAWRELERRARAELSSYLQPTGAPDAERRARLWTWFSLGLHTTWSLFLSGDVGIVVRSRWDREDAAARIGLRSKLPVPVGLLEPQLAVDEVQVAPALVEMIVARFRPHSSDHPSPSIGVDGVEYGFELAEDGHTRPVAWWGHSSAPELSELMALTAGPLDSLFLKR